MKTEVTIICMTCTKEFKIGAWEWSKDILPKHPHDSFMLKPIIMPRRIGKPSLEH